MTSAVVIGASGAIGRALVEALAAGGRYDTVFALARAPCAFAPPVRTDRIDVTDESSVAAAARRVGQNEPVGLVLVASGILHAPRIAPEKAIKALDPAAFGTVMAVNALGPALVAKHFCPLLPRAGRCVFAALSARVGSIGDNRLGGWYAYRASKAALNQILRNLALELARTRPEAIVAGLHPGTVASPLSAPFCSPASTPARSRRRRVPRTCCGCSTGSRRPRAGGCLRGTGRWCRFEGVASLQTMGRREVCRMVAIATNSATVSMRYTIR